MGSRDLAHLTLMLLRYLKDESIFGMPGEIALFSVSEFYYYSKKLLSTSAHARPANIYY